MENWKVDQRIGSDEKIWKQSGNLKEENRLFLIYVQN
jgi:hypothetical protein